MSGSEYPTSNLFLSEIYRVKEVLKSKALDENDYIKDMVLKMNEKFDKYWGECNLLMSIAAVLDPRCKMKLIEFCFPIIYPCWEVSEKIKEVREALYALYEEYYEAIRAEESMVEQSGEGGSSFTSGGGSCVTELNEDSGWSKFHQFVRTTESIPPSKSELDAYLEESIHQCKPEESMNFDAVAWWGLNNLKFHTLSRMACDILAIPASTVASEATFSAGGRIIDSYRSSLAIETVQALVCGADWVRNLHGVKEKASKTEDMPQEVVLPI
ncbi:zinc finger BED domain-containing protein RICESLEEPER 2-like isoform X1 [Tripterygium wilfordii]|uniref:zinc finger BED domain-containing protein RICESLEEPER 2-like isoform X1 n=1 Tax=Tripterygium wilfordii TaxID=458696 RepID=UPI0018F7FB9F|nr:zinc finger BED domain-containing protein RICESLEEPER 2-like isoform X1 [Tripterygium wilfordii]